MKIKIGRYKLGNSGRPLPRAYNPFVFLFCALALGVGAILMAAVTLAMVLFAPLSFLLRLSVE